VRKFVFWRSVSDCTCVMDSTIQEIRVILADLMAQASQMVENIDKKPEFSQESFDKMNKLERIRYLDQFDKVDLKIDNFTEIIDRDFYFKFHNKHTIGGKSMNEAIFAYIESFDLPVHTDVPYFINLLADAGEVNYVDNLVSRRSGKSAQFIIYCMGVISWHDPNVFMNICKNYDIATVVEMYHFIDKICKFVGVNIDKSKCLGL